MTTLKIKKRLMYTVFAFIFIFGGIEYAVILPTLWLYLHNVYDAPEYMLGLVLSAYSLAALFSAPIIGRMSDRFGCTKHIFLVCATFELVGSFLYFIEISQWLCLCSRFVSGMGAASEAVALAEVSRYTSEKERTAVISYLVAMRQIALLIGPGLNAFLRLAAFKIGPFEVNKYSAPGAFMVVVWGVLMLIVITLYTEPKNIYAQEMEETTSVINTNEQDALPNDTAAENFTEREHAYIGINSDAWKAFSEDCNNETEAFEQSHNRDYDASAKQMVYTSDSFYHTSSNDRLNEKDFLQSGDETPFEFPPVSYHSSSRHTSIDNDTVRSADAFKASYYGSFSSTINEEFHDIQQSPQNEVSCEVSLISSLDEDNHFINSCQLSSSLDLLISAERIINNSQYFKTMKDNKDDISDTGLVFNENHFGLNADDLYSNIPNRSAKLLLRRGHQRINHSDSQISLLRSLGANGPYIERSTYCLNDPIAFEGKLGFFCNEYIRDEIIAIIFLLFCAMFSQMCVETMVLPLSLKYLDFSELENSLLYCACGLEIIIVFVIVSKLSKCLSDRVMMIFGAVVILASNVWLICFLPEAPPHDRNHNIPIFAVAVFLDVLSLPFLLVCATSLYSKLTRKQTQGLSQGLRRGVVGLGTVIAPLWGSSAVNEPYLLLGVLLGLQGLSLVLCTLSYKRFKVVQAPSALSHISTVPSNEVIARTVNDIPSDLPVGANVSKYGKQGASGRHTAHSASYGSIQISLDGSSYHSLDISSEQQPLLPHPSV